MTEAPPIRVAPTLRERLARRSTEILVLVFIAAIAWRLASADARGRAMADRERRAIDVLRVIHQHQQAAVANGSERFFWLSEIVARSPEVPALRRLAPVDDVPVDGVEVMRSRGYLIALYLVDEGRDDERAWSPSAARTKDAGAGGYGVFAWPEEYSEGTQWVFYLNHRGKLLGSWNHSGSFDHFRGTFPPTVLPLREWIQGEGSGTDSEWFSFAFDDVVEIESPAVSAARAAGKDLPPDELDRLAEIESDKAREKERDKEKKAKEDAAKKAKKQAK